MQPASLLFQATTTHESESVPTKGEGRWESCEAKGLVGLPNDTSPSVPTEVAQAASRGRLKLRVLLSCHVKLSPRFPGVCAFPRLNPIGLVLSTRSHRTCLCPHGHSWTPSIMRLAGSCRSHACAAPPFEGPNQPDSRVPFFFALVLGHPSNEPHVSTKGSTRSCLSRGAVSTVSRLGTYG